MKFLLKWLLSALGIFLGLTVTTLGLAALAIWLDSFIPAYGAALFLAALIAVIAGFVSAL